MRMAKDGEVVEDERQGRRGRARLAREGKVGKERQGRRGKARSAREG